MILRAASGLPETPFFSRLVTALAAGMMCPFTQMGSLFLQLEVDSGLWSLGPPTVKAFTWATC